MLEERTPRGQIMPMVALLMVVILGMAAFAIDGSNIYSQHRRMQADLDVAVKVAASQLVDTSMVTQAITSAASILNSDGYASSLASISSVSSSCISDSGITFCTPPSTGSFSSSDNRYKCIEGNISRDIGGFFGGVIGLGRVHISVRAVACQGAHHQPYAMIGLCDSRSSCPGQSRCSIAVQDSAATLVVTGSIVGNSQDCSQRQGQATINGVVDVASTIAPTGSYTGMSGTEGTFAVSPVPDPFMPISITTLTSSPVITVCAACTYKTTDIPNTYLAGSSTVGSTCYTNVIGPDLGGVSTPPSNATTTVTYVFPPDNGNTPGIVDGLGLSAKDTYYFLPHCDGSPAIYYFTNSGNGANNYDITTAGGATVNSFNSVFVLDTSNNLINQTGNGGSNWYLRAPTTGPYTGMAISAHPTNPQPPCPSNPLLGLAGNAGSQISGAIDVPCAVVTLTGHSQDSPPTPFLDGAVVGYQINIAGSNTTSVVYDPSNSPASFGSALVE